MNVMNIIYIVEKEDLPFESILPAEQQGRKTGETSEETKARIRTSTGLYSQLSLATQGLLSASLISIPASLVLAAAVSRPIITNLLKKTPNESSTTLSEAEIRELGNFLTKHALTIDMAKEKGCRFPPGHPQVDQAYRLHPLSNLPDSSKGGVYIPYECFDQVLLDEREAELMRLLVDLGATSISITEKNSVAEKSSLAAGIAATSSQIGSATISGGKMDGSFRDNHETREFELVGKPWKRGDRLNRASYGWIDFEPSWGAIIAAREIGECTRATVEIREDATYSTNRQFSASFKTPLYGGDGSLDSVGSGESRKIYVFNVNFEPFLA
jgi:hypothetical protein